VPAASCLGPFFGRVLFGRGGVYSVGYWVVPEPVG